jgi:hypothetical protein
MAASYLAAALLLVLVGERATSLPSGA